MTQLPSPISDSPSPIRYIPLMVRYVTPLNIVMIIIAVVGAFLLANSLGGNIEAVEENLLVQSAVQVAEATSSEYDALRRESQRFAFTQGLGDALVRNDLDTLQSILEPLAVSGQIDNVIVMDARGQEILGLLRSMSSDTSQFSLSQSTDLSGEVLVQTVLNNATAGATGIMRTPHGAMIAVASPVRQGDSAVGVVIIGRYTAQVLENLQNWTIADVTLFAIDGTVIETTLDLTNDNRAILDTNPSTINQALSQPNQVTVSNAVSVADQTYRSAYIPFTMGETTLGALSIVIPDNVAFATAGGRQISAILMAILAGAVTFVATVAMSMMTRRVETVTETVEALSRGEKARVQMTASDEIGEMAVAINRYADTVDIREDQFRITIRKHRRERDYLLMVFESMPEGVIVMDVDGRVILMNEVARGLLGSHRVFRSAGIHELANVVNVELGKAIVPGMYALGNPQHIELEEKVLLAQASAVLVGTQQRIGSVILLRDITNDVRRERAREQIMSQIVEDVQIALQDASRQAIQSSEDIRRSLARDVAKHASTLQSLIVEMRELTQYSPVKAQKVQRPLSVETLVWAIANDWRQIALAGNVELRVMLEARGLYVLGDEQRLRYAIGNTIDNAIKYSQTGSKLSIEIRGENEGMAQLRIRDNGVGIDDEDLLHIFTRFYRGKPLLPDGEVIHVPGMGQGLTDARHIIQAHGGKIRVKSKRQIGTAVYIALPTTASQAYQLPLIEDDSIMEGETMLIPDNVTIEDFWGSQDELE